MAGPAPGSTRSRLTRTGSGVCLATVEDDCRISYSITSSARSGNDTGIVRPSALAVVKLTIGASLYRAISLGGRDLVGGQHGGHRFKHAIASNQCMKQGGCDMQQDHGKKCKGEIEVRVPQKCMQAVALR